MARKRYTEEQIVSILKESSAGAKTDELCRKYGVSQNTFYAWRTKFAGMTVPDIKKLRSLEEENLKLKRKCQWSLKNHPLWSLNIHPPVVQAFRAFSSDSWAATLASSPARFFRSTPRKLSHLKV